MAATSENKSMSEAEEPVNEAVAKQASACRMQAKTAR